MQPIGFLSRSFHSSMLGDFTYTYYSYLITLSYSIKFFTEVTECLS